MKQLSPETQMSAMLVDEAVTTGSQGYTARATYEVQGHVVRLIVQRDFYRHQSSAVAEVLTPGLTWTELAIEPTDGWHDGTPRTIDPASHSGSALAPVIDSLLERAALVLRAAAG